jgi:hypothetical protein
MDLRDHHGKADTGKGLIAIASKEGGEQAAIALPQARVGRARGFGPQGSEVF